MLVLLYVNGKNVEGVRVKVFERNKVICKSQCGLTRNRSCSLRKFMTDKEKAIDVVYLEVISLKHSRYKWKRRFTT